MIKYKDYTHMIPIQLRFSDVDLLNHVNNACYHSFFELARVTYFDEVLKDKINWKENGFILARTELDHLVPIFLGDTIYCYTKTQKIGTKSITHQQHACKGNRRPNN
jgi:acyl-CoA thioester hydrolase